MSAENRKPASVLATLVVSLLVSAVGLGFIAAPASAAAPTVTGVSPKSGGEFGGTFVTIFGSGFTGASAVNFGTKPTSKFTVNSANQITAISPASSTAGTVDVIVTTPGGTSAARTADQFTYVAPTVTGVSPSTGPTTGGTAVTITGTGFGGGDAVLIGSTRAANVTVNSDTSITATTPAEPAGVVDVTVIGPFGASKASSDSLFLFEKVPTALKTTPAIAQLSGLRLNLFNLSATLTDRASRAPIKGATIAFSAGGTTICTASTDDTGAATCNGSTSALPIILGLGYKATFAGDSTYLSSSATGPLIS